MRQRSAGFTLIELMITVAIVGVLAAVAIPAYMKYTRRSMITEATMNLRAMYDGAAAYYVTEHTDATGAILAKQFPNSAAQTPAGGPPAGVKHQPIATEFDTPEWSALGFAVRDPFRYAYTFTRTPASGNTGDLGSAIANGDLDGDGIQSTFSRNVTGLHDGVQGDSSLYSYNEIE